MGFWGGRLLGGQFDLFVEAETGDDTSGILKGLGPDDASFGGAVFSKFVRHRNLNLFTGIGFKGEQEAGAASIDLNRSYRGGAFVAVPASNNGGGELLPVASAPAARGLVGVFDGNFLLIVARCKLSHFQIRPHSNSPTKFQAV